MKAQEYMERHRKIRTMIQNKNVEILLWEDVALSITAHSDGERVQSSGSQQRMADAVDVVTDLKNEVATLKIRLYETEKEINAVIEQLKEPHYDVLHKRYIQDMSFNEIGYMRDRTATWATTTHGRALQALQALLDELERNNREEAMRILEDFEPKSFEV